MNDCYLGGFVQDSLKKKRIDVTLVLEHCIRYIWTPDLQICMVGDHQMSEFFRRQNVET